MTKPGHGDCRQSARTGDLERWCGERGEWVVRNDLFQIFPPRYKRPALRGMKKRGEDEGKEENRV